MTMPIKKLSEVGKARKVYRSLADRPTANQRGYNYEWQQYTKAFRRDHPLCCHCEQQATEHVDHIKAVSGPDDPLFWDQTNHQGLCHSCHSIKTAKEDGSFGRRKKRF